jgi:MscS family membrane protein
MKEYLLNLWHSIPYTDYFQNNYFASVAILIIFIVLAELILIIFNKYLQRWAKKTKTKIDDWLFERTKKPLFVLIITYGLHLSLIQLGWTNYIVNGIVNSVLVTIFLFLVMRVLDTLIDSWGETFAKKTKTSLDDVLLPLFHKIIKAVMVIICFMWILSIWKLDITPYLAGVGISGLVLGFALQDSLKNVFGGISLILDKNFKVSDPIRLESGELGTVLEIGLRSTKIKTYDSEVVFIPNGKLANMNLRNYVKPNSRVRKIVTFSVTYGTEVKKVKLIVLKAMKSVKDIYDDPYMDVIFTEMGDSGLHFSARFWVDWDNAYSKWLEVTEVVHSTLVKNGISIPFPTRTVHLKK